MYDYMGEREQRVQLFDSYLKQMVQRRADERRLDCAITFMEEPPDGSGTPSLNESAAKSLELVLAGDFFIGGQAEDFLDQTNVLVPSRDGADEGSQDGSSGEESGGNHRYLQFAFMPQTFYIDLPNNTLFPLESERLLRERSGFFLLRDRRQPSMSADCWNNTVKTWNPAQKIYLTNDTRSAAENMAFIFYALWKFPPDWQFYYRALVFYGRKRRDWEGEGPVR